MAINVYSERFAIRLMIMPTLLYDLINDPLPSTNSESSDFSVVIIDPLKYYILLAIRVDILYAYKFESITYFINYALLLDFLD